MSLARVWTIARRELRGYFDHATAYILLVVFLGVNFFFFFRDAYLVGEASLRPMMGLLPWLLLFFVPAVTMRSLAEERRAGMLELVLAQPIGVAEFLLGKFLGVFLFLAIAMAGTLGVPLGLSFGADLQAGVIVAQYVGAGFLIAALVAIGLWSSALTRNQVTAFILGVTITFALYLVGLEIVVLGLPGFLSTVAARLGVLGHFENVARGVIDLRDVLYFFAVTAAFLSLTYFAIMRLRLSRARDAYRRLLWGTAALVALAIVASLAGAQLRGRLDLTPGNLYTLSPPTRDLLRGLDDLVTIHFFRSDEIPPQFASIRRDVDDLLRDFDAAGGANLRVVRRAPDDDPEAAEDARGLGIQPVQFNVFGEAELQVREGYLGLALQYAGETETLPFVGQTRDLEYRLASAIRSMTRERRPAVAFLTGHGETDVTTRARGPAARLRDEYQVQSLRIDSTTVSIADSIDVLVVAGPQSPLDTHEGERIIEYVDRGGNALLLHPGPQVDRMRLIAQPSFHPVLDSLLARYGATVTPTVVYDLRARQNVQIPGEGGFVIVAPYPLWPYLQPASDHAIARDLDPVPVQWASELEIAPEVDSARVVPLLATSSFGGTLPLPTSVDAQRDWATTVSAEELGSRLVAAALLPGEAEAADAGGANDGGDAEGADGGANGDPSGENGDPGAGDGAESAEDGRAGRLVVAATASFASERALDAGGPGLVFLQNAIDWLAQDDALISIRSKDRSPPPLLFESEVARDAAKYGNLIGVPLLFILFGIARLARRRALQGRRFGAEEAAP